MKYLFYLCITTIMIALDQISKAFIVAKFKLFDSLEIIKDFFSITYVQNTGAGFSILTGKTDLLTYITPIAIILLVVYLLKSERIIEKVGLLMMIGGAFGNLIDRVFNKYVVDFLDFIIFGYDFPVFNIADCFLTIGVAILLYAILTEKKNA